MEGRAEKPRSGSRKKVIQVHFTSEEFSSLTAFAHEKGESMQQVLRDGVRLQLKLQAIAETPESVFHQDATTRLLITLLNP